MARAPSANPSASTSPHTTRPAVATKCQALGVAPVLTDPSAFIHVLVTHSGNRKSGPDWSGRCTIDEAFGSSEPMRVLRRGVGEPTPLVVSNTARPGTSSFGSSSADAVWGLMCLYDAGRGGGSSAGRAPGCGPGGRGFESRPPPFGPVAQRTERQPSKLRAVVRLHPGPFVTDVGAHNLSRARSERTSNECSGIPARKPL